ncbi:MAG: type II secretion system F family protein [Deltaproteobacteria bacterium]|nr:MAG: type II secretion system F family protein [Deltaproteobacteria bacterium]
MQALKNFFYVLIENLDYFGIFFLIFVAVAALAYATMTLLVHGPSETQVRLKRLLGNRTETPEEAPRPKFLGGEQVGVAAKISRPLHRLAATEDRSMRNRVRLRLIQAGYRSDAAFYNFLAAKIVLPALLILIYLAFRSFYRFSSDMIPGTITLVAIGYFTPNIWVWLMTKARQERIFKGLPDALDLMVVCVEAGLGLDMTFKRVGDEIRPLCKDLSDEFSLTNLEVRAGKSRDEAFRNMSLRTNVPEVHNLMTVLAQTSRFGTSLATALRIHADAMRVKRRQIAEETAAKATVKLIFPLVLFIFPAIFVVLIGPGAIKIVKYLMPVLGGGG